MACTSLNSVCLLTKCQTFVFWVDDISSLQINPSYIYTSFSLCACAFYFFIFDQYPYAVRCSTDFCEWLESELLELSDTEKALLLLLISLEEEEEEAYT